MSTLLQPPLEWRERVIADAARAQQNQNAAQQAVTAELLRRARVAGVIAFALTGSTARGRRTVISDLDYHVIGPRFDGSGFSEAVDVVTDSEERFFERLMTGDDFAQWTVRFGCVLFDDRGVMTRGADLVVRERLWPDASQKLKRAEELADLAEKVIGIQDKDAGQEHIRASLTAMARGLLLAAGVFPLARSELPSQVSSLGELALGRALERAIHSSMTLNELARSVDLLRATCQARSDAGTQPGEKQSESRVRKPSD